MSGKNLKTVAYNTIREKIINCEYMPGTFISEETLTNELGLSRTPVREALSKLEQERLVEVKPKRGVWVTEITIRDINMVFEMRRLLEPYVIEHYGERVPEQQLQSFYKLFTRMGRDKERLDDRSFFYKELDDNFHKLFFDSCTNTYICQNYEMLYSLNMRFRLLTGNISETRLDETLKEHFDILEPCMSGDWAAAAEKMRYHLDQSKKSTFELIIEKEISSIGL